MSLEHKGNEIFCDAKDKIKSTIRFSGYHRLRFHSSICEDFTARPITIRASIPLTKNNKNNITALKIEDTATMFDGVISADIEAHNTSEYEFLLKMKINSDKSDNEIIEALEKHINKIANIIKFNVGKIKYEIERV